MPTIDIAYRFLLTLFLVVWAAFAAVLIFGQEGEMIKAEVVFDGDVIRVNKYSIYRCKSGNGYGVYNKTVGFDSIEQAIKYCLEN